MVSTEAFIRGQVAAAGAGAGAGAGARTRGRPGGLVLLLVGSFALAPGSPRTPSGDGRRTRVNPQRRPLGSTGRRWALGAGRWALGAVWRSRASRIPAV